VSRLCPIWSNFRTGCGCGFAGPQVFALSVVRELTLEFILSGVFGVRLVETDAVPNRSPACCVNMGVVSLTAGISVSVLFVRFGVALAASFLAIGDRPRSAVAFERRRTQIASFSWSDRVLRGIFAGGSLVDPFVGVIHSAVPFGLLEIGVPPVTLYCFSELVERFSNLWLRHVSMTTLALLN